MQMIIPTSDGVHMDSNLLTDSLYNPPYFTLNSLRDACIAVLRRKDNVITNPII